MKLGVMSDLHGNTTAFDAVMGDAGSLGVDEWWILGDLIALGPDPVGILERLASLPSARVIAGNTERYVLSGDRPFPSLDDVRADAALLPRLVEVAVSFAWTRGVVTQAGWLPYLRSLPAELRTTLPDGTRLLGVHASPRSDDGAGIDTRIPDEALSGLLRGCEADLVIGGHTHDLTDRTVADARAVNPGSVSNASRSDGCATYAVLHIDPDGHRVEHRVVSYDHGAVLRAIEDVDHPASGYLRRFHERFL